MKNLTLLLTVLISAILFFNSCNKDNKNSGKLTMTFGHENIDIEKIPEKWINQAKKDLHIAYGHTSHGSQLITGMTGLAEWKGDLYKWTNGDSDDGLDIRDRVMSGDLGHNGDLAWESATRSYLDDERNSDINVIIWSWCGGVSDNTEGGIQIYLDAMNQLETDYPNVKFVYMTGHADINNDETLKKNNKQIRDYCKNNNKILFDFYDIESYDPDGTYYEFVSDNCNYYDSEGNHIGNWATEWQNSHDENVEWYDCYSAHSEPLNANMKAYAAWHLWARLAGWNGN